MGWGDTVKKLVTDGELPFVTVGKRKKVFGKDVLAYVALTASLPQPITRSEAQQQVNAMLEKVRSLKPPRRQEEIATTTPGGANRLPLSRFWTAHYSQ